MSTLASLQREVMSVVRGEAPPTGGLAAYRHQALAGWRAALAGDFPVVERLVGAAFFGGLAERYSVAWPSRSGDLNVYGRDFAQFIEGDPHAAQLPWLADVARLEWAVAECLAAADAPAPDFARFAALQPGEQERAPLTLHPAARRVSSPHPILAIWEANHPERDGTPEGSGGASRVLVTRVEGHVRPHAVDAAEWRALAALEDGASVSRLADALGGAAGRLPEILVRLAALGALGPVGRP